MKYDIVLAGVGGQGGLSVATIIAAAAIDNGFHVKQNEVHGMSQRGGAVVASLRISAEPIASDMIPLGTASMILSMEPLESLRYVAYLSPKNGVLITATSPVRNIPDYPELEGVLARIRAFPNSRLIEAEKIARELGAPRAVNVVMAGAASQMLPIKAETIEKAIVGIFGRKGPQVVEMNLKAFRAGRQAAQAARTGAGQA